MKPRNAELYAAVLANPDDDAPRLVYADWLTERGDPWGELIAVQIARGHADTPALQARERELLAAVPPGITYRRGFVEVLACRYSELEGLLADSCVRELRVFGATTVEELLRRDVGATIAAALPRMRLESLSVSTVTDDEMATLLGALDDSLAAFSYGLSYGPLPAPQVVAITESRLRVSSLTLHGIAADALAIVSSWHPLRRLSLE